VVVKSVRRIQIRPVDERGFSIIKNVLGNGFELIQRALVERRQEQRGVPHRRLFSQPGCGLVNDVVVDDEATIREVAVADERRERPRN